MFGKKETNPRKRIAALFLEKIDAPEAFEFSRSFWEKVSDVPPTMLNLFDSLIIFKRVLKFHQNHYDEMSQRDPLLKDSGDDGDDKNSSVITIAPPQEKFYPPIDNFAEKADRAALVYKNIDIILAASIPFYERPPAPGSKKRDIKQIDNINFDKNIKLLKDLLGQIKEYFTEDREMLGQSLEDLTSEKEKTGDPGGDLSKLISDHNRFIKRTEGLIILSDALIDYYNKKKDIFTSIERF